MHWIFLIWLNSEIPQRQWSCIIKIPFYRLLSHPVFYPLPKTLSVIYGEKKKKKRIPSLNNRMLVPLCDRILGTSSVCTGFNSLFLSGWSGLPCSPLNHTLKLTLFIQQTLFPHPSLCSLHCQHSFLLLCLPNWLTKVVYFSASALMDEPLRSAFCQSKPETVLHIEQSQKRIRLI